MNKFLVYTTNLPFMPKNMEEVINFAKEENKFRLASVELNPCLADVKAGDNIITKKGNSLFVIRAITDSLDNLDNETREYLDMLSREFGLKKVGITSVEHVIKFETWCKSVKPIINTKNNKEMNKNSIKSISARLKEMFMPTEAANVRIATDGNICVATDQGYVSIDADNNLTSYPEELTLDLPVFVISKSKDQLEEGDVIALERSYAKVVKIAGNKITAISYTGAGKTIHTIKDFLFNQTMVRVVVSMAGNVSGQINPMMLMMMSDKDDKKSLLPLLMMNQNKGALNINPMMLMMLSDKGGDSSVKDILMMSALGGNNMFGNMFGGQLAPQPAKPAQPEEGAEGAEKAEGVE